MDHNSFLPAEYEATSQNDGEGRRLVAAIPNWRYLKSLPSSRSDVYQYNPRSSLSADKMQYRGHYPGRKYVGDYARAARGYQGDTRQQNEIYADENPLPPVESSMWHVLQNLALARDLKAENDLKAELSAHSLDESSRYNNELRRLMEKRARRLG